MKSYKLVVSKDGKKFIHIYNDTLMQMDDSLGEFEVNRASDVYFCNEVKKWKVKFLESGEVSPLDFDTREEALDWEHNYLQETLKIA